MSEEKCIVMACVSFETVKVVEPAVEYKASEVHLFHYIRDPGSDSSRIYTEFYDEVCKQLGERLPECRIIEHSSSPIYNFQAMFRDILQTVGEIRSRSTDTDIGPDTKIVINSSAGTSEFSAAAIIASMMCPNVEAFTVGTSEYTIPNEEIERLYYRDGRPVGLTSSVHGARTIPKFFIDRPEENQVRALRSYYGRQVSGKTLSASAVIQQLKDDELWLYEMSASSSKTVPKQKETMYYQRHYVDNWVRNGWIEKPQGIGKYRLTDNGLVIINTFYVGDR